MRVRSAADQDSASWLSISIVSREKKAIKDTLCCNERNLLLFNIITSKYTLCVATREKKAIKHSLKMMI
jgi:hypothetical protein